MQPKCDPISIKSISERVVATATSTGPGNISIFFPIDHAMVKHTFIHAQAHTQSDDDQCTRRSGLDCQREMFFNGCFITIFFDYCVRYSFHQCHTRRETLDIFLSIVKTIFKVEVYLRRE